MEATVMELVVMPVVRITFEAILVCSLAGLLIGWIRQAFGALSGSVGPALLARDLRELALSPTSRRHHAEAARLATSRHRIGRRDRV